MMRRLHLCLLCLALLGMSQRSAADWRATLEQGRARYSNFAGGIPAPLALTALKSENPGTHQDLAAIAAQVGTSGQETITQAHKDIFDAKGTLTTTDDWKAKLKEQQDAVNADMKAHVDKSFNEAMNKIEALPADQRAAAADHYNSLAGSVSHAVAAVVDGTLGSIQDAIQDLLKGVVDVFVSSAENIGKQILGTITSWF